MFSKEVYAARRAIGLRGQEGPKIGKHGAIFMRRNIKGEPIPAHEGGIPHAKVGGKPVSKKAIRKNTKRARRANNVT